MRLGDRGPGSRRLPRRYGTDNGAGHNRWERPAELELGSEKGHRKGWVELEGEENECLRKHCNHAAIMGFQGCLDLGLAFLVLGLVWGPHTF